MTNFTTFLSKKLTTINGVPYQVFSVDLQARDIYDEVKKYFYKEHLNITWEEVLTTRFGLRVDTRGAVDQSCVLLQIEKRG